MQFGEDFFSPNKMPPPNPSYTTCHFRGVFDGSGGYAPWQEWEPNHS